MTDHLPLTALHATEILARAGGHIAAGQSADFIITDITIDSRRCRDGSLFVALPGTQADGHEFVVAAAKNGARAALVSRLIDDPALSAEGCTQILVGDSLRALGDLAVMDALPINRKVAACRHYRIGWQDRQQGDAGAYSATHGRMPREQGQFQQSCWRAADACRTASGYSFCRPGNGHERPRRDR